MNNEPPRQRGDSSSVSLASHLGAGMCSPPESISALCTWSESMNAICSLR